METTVSQNIQITSNKLSYPLRFLMFFRLIFGYFYKLSSLIVIRVFARSYCLIITITSIGYYYYCLNISTVASLIYCVTITVELCINRIISFMTEEDDVMKFLAKYDQNSYITHVFAVITILPVIICVISAMQGAPLITILIIIYMDMSLLVGQFTSLYTVYEFRNQVHLLRKSLAGMRDKHLSEEDKIEYVDNITARTVTLYNDFFVLDKVLRVKIIFGFSFDFLRICIIVYRFINTKGARKYMTRYLGTENLMINLVLCMPLIVMEFVFNDLDEMKTILANELLHYKDQNLRLSLHGAIDFLEAVKFTIWQEYPMDISSVLGFYSSLSIYIIVLLQVYDL